MRTAAVLIDSVTALCALPGALLRSLPATRARSGWIATRNPHTRWFSFVGSCLR